MSMSNLLRFATFGGSKGTAQCQTTNRSVFTSKFMLALLCLLISPWLSAVNVTVNDITYSLANDTVTIYDCPTDYVGTVAIPPTIEYENQPYVVGYVGNSAFQNCKHIESISLPESIVGIGYGAFDACTSLTSINIPDGVKEIMYDTFEDCYDLETITLPDGVTKIGNYAFANCYSLVFDRMPSSLISIGTYAFSKCKLLTTMTFPSTLETIGNSAFEYCYKLLEAKMEGNTPPTIISNSFQYTEIFYVPEGARSAYLADSEWEDYAIIDGDTPKAIEVNVSFPGTLGEEILKQVGDHKEVNKIKISGALNSADITQIQDLLTQLISIDMEEVIMTELPSRFFYDRPLLSEIILPAGLEKIGSGALQSCRTIKNLEIPAGVTEIEGAAFANCRNLLSLDFPASIKEISYSVSEGCWHLAHVSMPDEITSIGSYAFAYCEALEQFTFPRDLVTIGSSAFSNCDGLSSIEIPSKVKEINSSAFSGCENLASVTLPEGLTHLYSGAFSSCTSLTEMSIPASVIYCENPFSSCTNLRDVYIYSSAPMYMGNSDHIMSGVDMEQVNIYVPFYSINMYKVIPDWNYPNILPLEREIPKMYISGELTIPAGARLTNKPDVSVYYTDNSKGSLVVRGTDAFGVGHYEQKFVPQSRYTPKYTTLISESSAMTADSITFTVHFYSGGWHFMSFPFDVKRSEIVSLNDKQFVVRYYDAAGRATSNDDNWHNVGPEEVLMANTGYIFRTAENSWFRFKAIANEKMNNTFTGDNVVQTLNEHSSDLSHNASWNYIGNPYPCFYDIEYMDLEAPITIWEPTSSTYMAYSPLDDDYILDPGEAFFVQKPTDAAQLTFDALGRQVNTTKRQATGVQRLNEKNEREVYNLYISNGVGEDRTRIVINPKATVEYDMGMDASKFLSMDNSVAQLYSLDVQENMYAINERIMGDGVVRLGLYAPSAGEYSLLMTCSNEKSVILVDKLSNEEFDLNQGEAYSFHAEEGWDNGRFEVRIAPEKVPTGLVEAGVENTQVRTTDDRIVVEAPIGSSVAVYSLSGQAVYAAKSDKAVIEIPMSEGFYVVKVDNLSFKVMLGNK